MKRQIRSFALLGLAIYVAVTFQGCASFRFGETKQAIPEPVGNYVVMVYELPFVYQKDNLHQEEFLSVIREVIAPADYEKGPDHLTAVANMLVVSTTAQNHMRLERFFGSIPDTLPQHPEVWTKSPEKTEMSE